MATQQPFPSDHLHPSTSTCNCLAYAAFKESLETSRKHCSVLKPRSKDSNMSEDFKNAVPVFIRGAVVSTVANWDAYVSDVLREAFDLAAKQGEGNLSTLKKKWSHCQTAIQNAIQRRANTRTAAGTGSTDQKPTPSHVVAFELLEEPNSWKKLLDEERDYQLKQLKPLFTTLGRNDTGIDAVFGKMFIGKASEIETDKGKGKQKDQAKVKRIPVSQGVINVTGRVKYTFTLESDDPSRKFDIKITDPTTLNEILRLYYGLRCTFAHGQSDSTYRQGGDLYDGLNLDQLEIHVDSLESQELKSQLHAACLDSLRSLYELAKKHGAKAEVSYFDLVNLNRFFLNVSRYLFQTISAWFYGQFKVCIWRFDPAKAAREMTPPIARAW